MLLMGGLFVSDNAEFFKLADEQIKAGHSWKAMKCRAPEEGTLYIPAINETTGEVEGILVRGETDFVYKNSCRVSNVCADDGCRGEDVTRITDVFDALRTIRKVESLKDQKKQEIKARIERITR